MKWVYEHIKAPDLPFTTGEKGEMVPRLPSPARLPDGVGLGAAATPGGERTLSIRLVTTEEEFASLRDAWDVLASESQSTIFQTFDWQYLWWKYYRGDPGRSLHILVVQEQGHVVGIFPFFLEQITACGVRTGNRLRMLGCGVPTGGYPALLSDFGVSDYLAPLILPGYHKDIIRTMTEYYGKDQALFDECLLEHVPASDVIIREIVPELEKLGYHCSTVIADLCPRINVPKSIEEYKQKLKPQTRRQVNQVQKALGTLYDIVPMNTAGEVDSAFQQLVSMHQQRWNEMGYPGLFADSRFELFQRELLPKFLAHGKLWCKIVRAGDTCIAVRIGYVFGKKMYDYLSGFDVHSPEARRRPGNALLLAMIGDAVSMGLETVDLLRGDEAYKNDFADRQSSNFHVRIIFPRRQSTARKVLYAVLHGISHTHALVQKEYALLRIQFRVHGSFRGAVFFVRFRLGRFMGKVRSRNRKELD